jgi:hypothetical protein
MHLEVSSFAGACEGTPLEVNPGTPEAPFELTAEAGIHPFRHPGAPEQCLALVDMNCDGLAGCDDPTCAACDLPPVCHLAAGAVCAQSGCEYPRMAAGSECAYPAGGGRCTETGTCIPESEFCLDCSQDGCAGRTCTDDDACTDDDVCDGTGSCTGTPRSCTAGACHLASCVAGTCVEEVDVGPPATRRRACRRRCAGRREPARGPTSAPSPPPVTSRWASAPRAAAPTCPRRGRGAMTRTPAPTRTSAPRTAAAPGRRTPAPRGPAS